MPEFCSSNPSDGTEQWYVWDVYQPLPPKPVFFGTMEDAGLVADALNACRALHTSGDRDA